MSTGTAVTGIVAGSVDLTDISNWKYQIVKLTPTTESEGFLALTDAQLSQQTELVFNGTGSVTVEKLYMAYKGTSPYFVPINNPAYSVQWMFEKAESVKNKNEICLSGRNRCKTERLCCKRCDFLICCTI